MIVLLSYCYIAYIVFIMKLIFATHNEGKILEMRQILVDLDIEISSADEVGVTEDVIEDGATFFENALKKARFVAERIGEWSVADDSGLCIEALGGAPGVYSTRWAGDDFPREKLVDYTLERMKNVPKDKRQAYFEGALALVAPDRRHWVFTGRVNGRIAFEKRGRMRPKLPYDLIFIPEGFDCTFSEMTDEQKNGLSHRGRAFEELKEFLRSYL